MKLILRNVFQITDEEALLINAVIEEVMHDNTIVNHIADNAKL